MAADIHYRQTLDEGIVTLAFSSELGMATAPALKPILAKALAEHDAVAIDLAAVDHLDSTGLSCIIAAYREAQKQGKRFWVSAVNMRSRHVLKLARVDRLLMPDD